MLTNCKQYLASLVSAVIVRYQQYIKYHPQFKTSIAMVLTQHSTDGFVSIWYHHSTDSGNFQKTFDA
jgi:hypothetical protein